MKRLVWLLVFINVGLLAYFNLDRILPSAPQVKLTEIDAEKITVLSQKQIETLPKKAASSPSPPPPSTPPAVTACFEWGVFSTSSIASAQNAVTKLALQATVKEQNSQEAKRFWVYRPPVKTAQEAQTKAAELKAAGVEDLYVVQDPKWKNAISFGIFEDEQLATKLLNELKAKGVKDVVKTLRNQGQGHSSLLFNNLTTTEVTALNKLKPDFPEADLKEVNCH